MSIHINWGPPGSYKTYHSIKDSISIIFKTERFFISNVEGLSLRNLIDKFGKDYGLDTFSKKLSFYEKRQSSFINLYFHDLPQSALQELIIYCPFWLPFSSYVLLDECQIFYPTTFSQRNFDETFPQYPSQIVQQYYEKFFGFSANFIKSNLETVKKQFSELYSIPVEDQEFNSKFSNYLDHKVSTRPTSLHELYSLHRHFYFDFLFTCQNIKQVSASLLRVCEGAHYCKNMARFGFKSGKYRRYYHSALSAPSKRDKGEGYVIDKRVFSCYKSTSIGTHSETISKQDFFSGFKFKRIVLAFIIAIICIIFFIYYVSTHSVFSFGQKKDGNISTQTLEAPDQNGPKPTNKNNSNPTQTSQTSANPPTTNPPSDNIKNTATTSNPKNTPPPPPTLLAIDSIHPNDDFFYQKVYVDGFKLTTEKSGKRQYTYAGVIIYEDGSTSTFNIIPFPYQLIPISRCLYQQYRFNQFIRYIHCSPKPKHDDETRVPKLQATLNASVPPYLKNVTNQ